MKGLKLGAWALFTLALIAAVVGLVGSNADTLTVSLYSWVSPPLPKWQVLLIAVAVGAVLATLFFIVDLIILETRVVRLRRSNQRLERSLESHHGAKPEAGQGREEGAVDEEQV